MLRGFIALAAVGIIVLVIVARYSEATASYVCEGHFDQSDASDTSTLHIRLSAFRWWVRFWSDGVDGVMHLELPDGRLVYYAQLEDVGLKWLIAKDRGDISAGSFSKLSQRLRLDTPSGEFDGECHAL